MMTYTPSTTSTARSLCLVWNRNRATLFPGAFHFRRELIFQKNIISYFGLRSRFARTRFCGEKKSCSAPKILTEEAKRQLCKQTRALLINISIYNRMNSVRCDRLFRLRNALLPYWLTQRGIVANRVACLCLLRATVLVNHHVWTSWQEWDRTPRERWDEREKRMSIA